MIALSPLDIMVAQFRIKGYVGMFIDVPTYTQNEIVELFCSVCGAKYSQ